MGLLDRIFGNVNEGKEQRTPARTGAGGPA
jgi:hypothetical protein